MDAHVMIFITKTIDTACVSVLVRLHFVPSETLYWLNLNDGNNNNSDYNIHHYSFSNGENP